ncbi:pollen-specific leucine-rich repeat extensin-like protein 3 [Iris pallida]|uniref:Pollen-specific leucine-rich repeat extensin-like protein 3 n=1 Tax=Iris pallida TaxID=29817 RepID=A0AAX6FDK8_IRIPA|nr:pollen-specific leucine-rich repeat extensin-like protein 3 [Iris pallida]
MVVVVVSLDEVGVGRNGRVGGCVGRSAAESSAGGTTLARKRRARPGFRARTDARYCCAHSSRRQPGNADGVGSACGMRRSLRRLRSGAPICGA